MSQVDYKSTLNLPRSSLSMKGHLPQTEPKIIKKWKEERIYEKVLERNQLGEKFLLIDGPPYANGSIHLGHVLNKVLKDIVIKYKSLSGFYAPFIPGWDCHGLPIELKVMKKLKSSLDKNDKSDKNKSAKGEVFFQEKSEGKEGLGREEKLQESQRYKKKEEEEKKIRKLCKEEALKWVRGQSEEFQRLGILADWEHPYLTLNAQYEAEEIRFLATLHKKGFLKQGEKPVHWCPRLQTALAAAEVEYFPHKSLSIYVKFKLSFPLGWQNFPFSKKNSTLSDASRLGFENFVSKISKDKTERESFSFLIWTTTPWTLPANQAVALHPDFKYKIYKHQGENFIFAEFLKEKIEKETGLLFQEHSDSCVFKGQDLEGLQLRHPFLHFSLPVILSEFVTLDVGTGCVHTAPSHGMEDYKLGLRYRLKVESPVDERGCYTDKVPEYKGESIWKVNAKIVSRLKSSSSLLFGSEITHHYPYNPRTESPLIFRSTPQWFISMRTDNENLRERALASLSSEITFFPLWGKDRLESMITHAPDWCLSRQRLWGVPFPVFYCKKCKEALVETSLMLKIADHMEKTGEGIEAYFSTPLEVFLEGRSCSHCGNQDPNEFQRSQDILDVWFDSGVCHWALHQQREEVSFPADLYLEGSDQHRGWFQTSLLSSLAYGNQSPYKKLITHGFVLDKRGHKMSKSKGNVIEPSKIIRQFGAEILRLLVASEDYGQDLNVSGEVIQRVQEVYRKIRNTLRFLLGNLYDFSPDAHRVEPYKMPLLDQWMLSELNEMIEKVTEEYEAYRFYRAYQVLNHFFTVTLSSLYLDILKDRLYTWAPNSLERRASQTVFYDLLQNLVVLMAPILSFLAEEVYALLPLEKEKKFKSVFLNSFPKRRSSWSLSQEKKENFSFLLDIRSKIQKSLEQARQNQTIGSNLEAKVMVQVKKEERKKIFPLKDVLHEMLIVSQLELQEPSEQEDQEEKEKGFCIRVCRAHGIKCPRCWHYSSHVKKEGLYPGLCPKCVDSLKAASCP